MNTENDSLCWSTFHVQSFTETNVNRNQGRRKGGGERHCRFSKFWTAVIEPMSKNCYFVMSTQS